MVHPDEMYCSECGGPLKEIGFTKVCNEIQYVPSHVKIIWYMQRAVNVLHASIAIIFYSKSSGSQIAYDHFLASAGSVARVMYQKYVNADPLYR